MKRGNKPYSVTFESLVMRLVKHIAGQRLCSLEWKSSLRAKMSNEI